MFCHIKLLSGSLSLFPEVLIACPDEFINRATAQTMNHSICIKLVQSGSDQKADILRSSRWCLSKFCAIGPQIPKDHRVNWATRDIVTGRAQILPLGS